MIRYIHCRRIISRALVHQHRVLAPAYVPHRTFSSSVPPVSALDGFTVDEEEDGRKNETDIIEEVYEAPVDDSEVNSALESLGKTSYSSSLQDLLRSASTPSHIQSDGIKALCDLGKRDDALMILTQREDPLAEDISDFIRACSLAGDLDNVQKLVQTLPRDSISGADFSWMAALYATLKQHDKGLAIIKTFAATPDWRYSPEAISYFLETVGAASRVDVALQVRLIFIEQAFPLDTSFYYSLLRGACASKDKSHIAEIMELIKEDNSELLPPFFALFIESTWLSDLEAAQRESINILSRGLSAAIRTLHKNYDDIIHALRLAFYRRPDARLRAAIKSVDETKAYTDEVADRLLPVLFSCYVEHNQTAFIQELVKQHLTIEHVTACYWKALKHSLQQPDLSQFRLLLRGMVTLCSDGFPVKTSSDLQVLRTFFCCTADVGDYRSAFSVLDILQSAPRGGVAPSVLRDLQSETLRAIDRSPFALEVKSGLVTDQVVKRVEALRSEKRQEKASQENTKTKRTSQSTPPKKPAKKSTKKTEKKVGQ